MRNETLTLPAVMIDRPWFVAKDGLRAVVERASIRYQSMMRMDLAAIDAAVAAAAAAPLGRVVGSIAVIPIAGPITQKADFYSWWFGGTSVERLTATFRQYQQDPNVTAIVFDVDSPGGEVYGVPEFFDEVYAARGTKTLVAVSNPFMASAAYWIGCACDEVYLLPSGQAGSVGCYTMHADMSAMLEEMGVKVTFIKYGEHKTDGNPYEPLSDSAREELQSGVDFYGSWFDKSVAKARGISLEDVKAKFGQGRVLRAPDAKKVGMVDKVGSLEDVLAKLSPKRIRGFAAAGAGAPLAAADEGPVEPSEDGTCPDGYEKGDDGMCHVETKASADQAAADHEAITAVIG